MRRVRECPEVGWVCGELATLTSCGFIAAGVEDAPLDLGGLNLFANFFPAQVWQPQASSGHLYAVGHSGKVYCLDASRGVLCSGSGSTGVAEKPTSSATRFVFTAAAGATQSDPQASYVATVSARDERGRAAVREHRGRYPVCGGYDRAPGQLPRSVDDFVQPAPSRLQPHRGLRSCVCPQLFV